VFVLSGGNHHAILSPDFFIRETYGYFVKQFLRLEKMEKHFIVKYEIELNNIFNHSCILFSQSLLLVKEKLEESEMISGKEVSDFSLT
jgi:hypothetical protein